MEPTGRRKAPPDDRLREIRDSRKSLGRPRIALRCIRTTLLIDFAPVGIGWLREINSRPDQRNALQCSEQRMTLARADLFTSPGFRELAQTAVFTHERLHVRECSPDEAPAQCGTLARDRPVPDCASLHPGYDSCQSKATG